MIIKAELLYIKFSSVAHSALEEFQCTVQKGEVITTVLSWDLSPACDFFEWVLAVLCMVGFERPGQELPRNGEQGNVVVSFLDFLLKNRDNSNDA